MQDGAIRQPFEYVVLEQIPGENVRLASIGPAVIAANLIPPAARTTQAVPGLETVATIQLPSNDRAFLFFFAEAVLLWSVLAWWFILVRKPKVAR